MLGIAADAAPGATPGTAVRSIAAEDYRLARDRRVNLGRERGEARPDRPIEIGRTPYSGKMGLYCRATG